MLTFKVNKFTFTTSKIEEMYVIANAGRIKKLRKCFEGLLFDGAISWARNIKPLVQYILFYIDYCTSNLWCNTFFSI